MIVNDDKIKYQSGRNKDNVWASAKKQEEIILSYWKEAQNLLDWRANQINAEQVKHSHPCEIAHL